MTEEAILRESLRCVSLEGLLRVLGLGWPTLVPIGLKLPGGQGRTQRWRGEARGRRRSSDQGAVVWGTQPSFQRLLLPLCVPSPASDAQRCAVFKEFHPSLAQTQRMSSRRPHSFCIKDGGREQVRVRM